MTQVRRDFYREIRARTDIAALVRVLIPERITSERKHTIEIDCPHHDSQSGRAFHVSTNKGFWYCHACKKGGDAIQLVEFVRTGNVTKSAKGCTTASHREARDWLAQFVGVEPLSKTTLTPEERAQVEADEAARADVFGTLTSIADYYHAQLLASPEQLAWLDSQYGFGRDVVDEFKLGWADGHEAGAALTKQFSVEQLVATGAFRFDGGRLHPFFQKRIVIPYRLAGQVRYMAGRRTPWSPDSEYEQAKYKKLPLHHDTDRPWISKFIENGVLFNEDALTPSDERVIVVEGFMDAVAAHMHGFRVVSPATVKLTESDRKRLVLALRNVKCATVVMDNELSAVGGESAVQTAKDLDVEGGPQVDIVTLPLGKKQLDARAEIKTLLGDKTYDRLIAAKSSERRRILDDALDGRPEDAARVKELSADAKLDVCDWFRAGGTREAFDAILETGRDWIEQAIDAIPDEPRAQAAAVHQLLREIEDRNPLLREQYLKLIKNKTGLTLKALHAQSEYIDADGEGLDPQLDRGRFLSSFYERRAEGMARVSKFERGEVVMLLTNFPAEIKATEQRDDGFSIQRTLVLEATVGRVPMTASIPANEFAGLGWVIPHFGPQAIVNPGASVKDLTRAAIQYTSTKVEKRTVYTHTGWREIDGEWCFLHAGGAIRPNRTNRTEKDILVDLPAPLALYSFPVPPVRESLVRSIGSVLALLGLAPARIVFALIGAAFRSVFGGTNHGLHLVGPTGVFKSELAALFQQFFGAGMDAAHLPASWESTANFLESVLSAGKDTLTFIDDFKPKGPPQQIQKLHLVADRVFRGQGNRSGRGRMAADLSLNAQRPPQGFVGSTGEETPSGESLRARLTVIEVAPGDVRVATLTTCQKNAANGDHAAVMAAFIQRIADRREEMFARVTALTDTSRERMTAMGMHRRTPRNVADLHVGVEMFLEFALDAGAITESAAKSLREQSLVALVELADAQQAHVQAGEPTLVFIQHLRSAVASGEAFVASRTGEVPIDHAPQALGWRFEDPRGWQPYGTLVGWIDDDDLYLDLTSSYKAAQRMAGDTTRLTIDERTLSKRLSEKGLLVTEEYARGKHTVRRSLQGVPERSVLHLSARHLLPTESRSDQSDGADETSEGEPKGNEPPPTPAEDRTDRPNRTVTSTTPPDACPNCKCTFFRLTDDGRAWECADCQHEVAVTEPDGDAHV